MAHERLQAMVGTAIVDTRFRQSLLNRRADAISKFDLTPEESEAVCSIRAETIEAFASELHRWILGQGAMRRMTPAMARFN